MSLRKSGAVVGFDKFDAENIPDFETALNDAISVLEEKGMEGKNQEPEVTIVLRNTVQARDGFRAINATVYIGATTQDVAQDLNKKI